MVEAVARPMDKSPTPAAFTNSHRDSFLVLLFIFLPFFCFRHSSSSLEKYCSFCSFTAKLGYLKTYDKELIYACKSVS